MPSLVRMAFPIGAAAMVYSVLRPHPLVSAGPALIGTAIFAGITGIAIFTAPPKLRHRPGHKLACLLPWILTAMLVINWWNDRSPELHHRTSVIEAHYSHGWDYLVVRSWRPGRKREVLFVRTWFVPANRWPAFHSGDAITVSTRAGSLKLPWIASLSR